MSERLQPFHREAEMSALGSCLLSERSMAEMRSIVSPEMFYIPAHQTIFGAMIAVKDEGKALEYLTLNDQLSKMGRLADSGGSDYLIELAGFPPGPSNSNSYAEIVKERWTRRQIEEIGASALDGEANLDTLFLRLQGLKDQSAGGELRSGLIGQFAGKARKRGVHSGFRFIDDNTTTQGFPEGQMSLVTAYTGTGKTAFMIQCAYEIASLGDPVFFGTWADMSGEDLADRLVKNICGWSYEPPAGHPAQEKWHAAVREVQSIPIYVNDATEMRTGRDIETFAAKFDAEYQKQDWRIAFLDYAQELKSSKRGIRSSYEHAEECSDVIKWLAARTKRPMVVGSQVTVADKRSGQQDETKGGKIWGERAGYHLRLKTLEDDEIAKVDGAYRGIEGLTSALLVKNRFGKKKLHEFWSWQSDYARFREL